MKKTIITIAFYLFCAGANAAQSPVPGKQDQRITTIAYQANDVITVKATYGISTMVIFDTEEKFVTVSLGDTESWQVAPSETGNILFVKPIAKNITTNMNVVTNKRVYFIELQDVERTKNFFYGVRFTYPEKNVNDAIRSEAEYRASYPNLSAIDKEHVNLDYSFKGAGTLKPVRIFDDGKKTFFKFRGKIPAIFAVNDDYSETLINYHKEGEYVVVDQTAPQYTLRDGQTWTCIFNLRKDDFGQTVVDADGPKVDEDAKIRSRSGNKK